MVVLKTSMDFVRFFLKHASSYVLLEHWETTALRVFFKTVNLELNSEPQIPWGISRSHLYQQLYLVGENNCHGKCGENERF